MGKYVENNLMSGEKLVYEAKLHVIVYLPPLLVQLLALILFAVVPTDIVAVLVIVIAIMCTFWCVLIHGGRQFFLTSKRVIVKQGIIERKINELMLRKCEGIQVEQSILGRILNYGTLLVTTGEATNSYKSIKKPIEFSTRINEQIDKLKENL